MSEGINHIQLDPGELVRGQYDTYVLQQEIGEGGFGTVYKARGNSGEVAIKIIKLWKVMPNDRTLYTTRLQQEFEISTRINSPNVVRGFDFSFFQGNPFIVMEFCEGGTLKDYMPNSSYDFAVRMAIDVLKGLDSLHKEGIIHRDIKPENILFNSRKRAKLVDFGICASIRKRHTQPNILGYVKEVFATITYSPPEQTDAKLAFKSVAPTNDIYAFGVTMFEYFTGQFPFGSFEQFQGDHKAYDLKKKNNNWDRKALANVTSSQDWYEIIEKCLQPKPQDRYQSVQEIISILDKGSYEIKTDRSTHIRVGRSQHWVLKVMLGDDINREYDLSLISNQHRRERLTMGWFDSDNPLLNDIGITENLTKYISRFHATLALDVNSNTWSIRDGQLRSQGGYEELSLSRNGVFVNSEKISETPYQLLPDDIITLGDTTLKVILK